MAVLVVACAPYAKRQGLSQLGQVQASLDNPYFSDLEKDYVYKARIDAFGRSFGGLFIIKKMGQGHHRLAFTTEMGSKIFDFVLQGDRFTVNHILGPLDRKVLLGILEKDFKVLLAEKPVPLKAFIKDTDTVIKADIASKKTYYFKKSDTLHRIVTTVRGKEKTAFLFSDISGGHAGEVVIRHTDLDLTVHLRSI